MARTLILRPTYDVHSQHQKTNGFNEAWDLINDEISDEDSTKISDYVRPGEEHTLSSEVGFEKKEFHGSITQIKVSVNRKVSIATGASGIKEIYTIKFENEEKVVYNESMVATLGYVTKTSIIEQDDSFIASMNSYISKNNSLPDIRLNLLTHASVPGQKDGDSEINITQVWIELLYNDLLFGISEKKEGAYKYARVAYKKGNSTWSEISEEEAKSILKNNTIRRGVRKE